MTSGRWNRGAALARRAGGLAALLVTLGNVVALCAADDASPETETLWLRSGDYVQGVRQLGNEAGQIHWQSPWFAEPLAFPLQQVSHVAFPLPEQLPNADGAFCFELARGDVVFGDLLAITDQQIELQSPRFGRLLLDRHQVYRFYRRSGGDLVYSGPDGLQGWESLEQSAPWQVKLGRPVTDKPQAALYSQLGLPEKALIDIELSWENKADFVLGLAVDSTPTTFTHAFRLEVWRSDLVLLRETGGHADLVSLDKLATGPGSLRLLLYLDQRAGTIAACRPSGEIVGQLALPGNSDEVLGGIRLANVRGDLMLRRLRVTRWDGTLPTVLESSESSLVQADGSSIRGRLRSFDASQQQFTVENDGQVSRLPLAQITGALLSPPSVLPPATLQIDYLDGSQLSGEPLAWQAGSVQIEVSGSQQPITAPLSELRMLQFHQMATDGPPAAASDSGREGTLRMHGVQLRGQLMDSADGRATCLVWRPAAAVAGAALRPDATGRIVYREPVPVRRSPQPRTDPQAGGLLGGIARIFTGGTQASIGVARPGLHLRTGDSLPCEVQQVNEKGVTIRSPVTDQTFVPHDQVKAAELQPDEDALRLARSKRERLLMLPRILRDSPPTHLLRSSNGDFLRGRLLAMDDDEIEFEVRLERKRMPRSRITHIIWLHEDELNETGAPDQTDSQQVSSKEPGDSALRVQAVRGDGIRLTFYPEAVRGETLFGTSDLLGRCQVRIAEVDQLLVGSEITKAAARLPYQRWKLSPAPAPRVVAETGDDPLRSGHVAGTESPLVDQPAPDFELPRLEGGTFRLSERRGKIVVLDFFATWCGPCLQTMPQVEQVVDDLSDRGVELVGVNLEESPEQIRALFERHSFKLPAVLDRDGAVSARYAVSAIPQTVVISRDGKVARLFVGGGPKFGEQLRTALLTLLTE